MMWLLPILGFIALAGILADCIDTTTPRDQS